jgi:hypothetical protein
MTFICRLHLECLLGLGHHGDHHFEIAVGHDNALMNADDGSAGVMEDDL